MCCSLRLFLFFFSLRAIEKYDSEDAAFIVKSSSSSFLSFFFLILPSSSSSSSSLACPIHCSLLLCVRDDDDDDDERISGTVQRNWMNARAVTCKGKRKDKHSQCREKKKHTHTVKRRDESVDTQTLKQQDKLN